MIRTSLCFRKSGQENHDESGVLTFGSVPHNSEALRSGARKEIPAPDSRLWSRLDCGTSTGPSSLHLSYHHPRRNRRSARNCPPARLDLIGEGAEAVGSRFNSRVLLRYREGFARHSRQNLAWASSEPGETRDFPQQRLEFPEIRVGRSKRTPIQSSF